MRNIPGWVTGAIGVSAIVGAFVLGSRAGATSAARSPHPAPDQALAAPAPDLSAGPALAVECGTGQRAVVHTAAGTPSVACVTDAPPVGARTEVNAVQYVTPPRAPAAVVHVTDRDDRPTSRPAVLTEPVEVYRPRSRPAPSTSSEVEAPRRSVRKSVAIIAGSTAAGAVMGGVVKGRKGAVVGAIVGGGAATVWDQVTRRPSDDVR